MFHFTLLNSKKCLRAICKERPLFTATFKVINLCTLYIYICLVINFYTAIMKIYLYFRLFQMFRQMLRICQGAQLSLSRVKLHPGRRTKTKELVNRILLSVSVVSFIFSFGFGSING